MTEHPFAPYVRILGKGKSGARSLTREEANIAMGMILRGEVDPVQLGAFLMLLRVKEESAEELAGFVTAVRSHCNAPEIAIDLDWASYAGKRRQHPWYLLAALALADSGLKIVMHGAAGHTADRVYSEHLLRELGETVTDNWEDCAVAVAERRFAYVPLRQVSAPLQDIIELRNLFGLRSPVHTLSRLLNPLNAPYSVQSIFHPAYGDSHQRAAQLLGQAHAAVFKGEAGEAERKPEATCTVKYVHNGELSECEWPRLLEGRQPWQEQLDVDTLRAAWCHNDLSDYGHNAILGTIAIVLQLRNPDCSPDECLQQAAEIWQNRDLQRLQTSN